MKNGLRRHRARSETIHRATRRNVDCFVASRLAMTRATRARENFEARDSNQAHADVTFWPRILVCEAEKPILGFSHRIYAPAWMSPNKAELNRRFGRSTGSRVLTEPRHSRNADAALAEQLGQAAMTVSFVMMTSNLDLALTKVAEGRPVFYCGPHQGVFRFESVKAAALMRFRTSPCRGLPGLPEGQETAFRKFLSGA